MNTIEEAKRLLFANVPTSGTIALEIKSALGHILAEDVFSPIDLPLFNQSVMDGYAIATGDLLSRKEFNVLGEIKAGDVSSVSLKAGEAVRIFTGAPVPATADAVIMQEKVKQVNGSIYLAEDIRQGEFIRQKGSQIKHGELALKKNVLLNPASIGFLASLGVEKVKVYSKPEVSILVTGDEIIMPGNDIQAGKVYESNSFSFLAALQQMQIKARNVVMSRDDKNDLKRQIEKSLSDSDILLITGGISVGKYDYVYDVLKELNVEIIFYKVLQKPGKPLLTGKINKKLIFALPGNSASALVCFYEYVYPVIRMMQGIEKGTLPVTQLKLLKDVSKTDDKGFFIHARITDHGVMPLEKQDSSMLRTFADADALIYIPMGIKHVDKGTTVEVHLLPFNN